MSDESNRRVPLMPAGWYDDPTSAGEARYWDGFGWSTSISTNGVTSTAAIEPALVGVPPVRGSEFRAHRRVTAPIPPTPPPVTMTRSAPRSPVGAMLAAVIALVVIVALVVLLTRDGDGDTPPPDTDVPATAPAVPATEAPAAEADPVTTGN